jgi:cytochrome c553
MRQAVILLLLAASSAPAAAAESQAAADVSFFETKVRPLLAERCQRCHSTRAKKQKGGLLLDSRAGILKGGGRGAAVVPGQPEKSLLVQAVRYANDSLQMPPGGRLPPNDVAVLEEWVRRGAPFPEAGAAVDRKAVDLGEGRKFWSFQPPQPVAPPATRDRAWPQRRLDAFVLAELEKHGLTPSGPASRRVLIRRATFDLLGRPPTPEEVEAFANDPDPDAYARLVDRLLASPLYGERWGRFWLDLARYCDIAEPWSETRGQPWLYRDWVVQAFNDDLPYDQFVQRQLAADLMPEASRADQAALGFLGLSPVYWKELKLDKDVIKAVVAEEWEERIGAVSSTFLGLTVACARCHDHKFDPITQQDYYALAGVLASTRQADRALDVRSALAECRLPAATPAVGIDAAFTAWKVQSDVQRGKILLAPAVGDASLHVVADGPHRTKLEWQPRVAQDVSVQVRGNPTNLGPVVPRRFLAVLSPDPPRPFGQGSGRLELARAIVTEGRPLAARVIVNRVWKQHFGTGLVETPSDFGAQGARPSHPELLDDLAARFIASGWSLKALHREIMLSATYQQSSAHDAARHAVDPDNRWLWRMNRRRLEVEAWRDAMLAVSGTLRLERGGPAQDLGDPNNRRRTLYGTVKRRELSDLLRLNDFPDPTAHSPGRVPTTTPLQQLFVLNSPFVQQQAAALTQRLKAEAPGGTEARVQRAYHLLYGRPATAAQVKLAVEFLTAGRPDEPVSDAVWTDYAQVLLGSNEFLFVD